MNRKEKIRELYASGLSYRELQKKGYHTTEITKSVRGMRTPSECQRIARAKGAVKLTEEGRKKLSECGKRAVKKNRKFWTKPEREFMPILNELEIGVKFPKDIRQIFKLKDDCNFNNYVFFQYPIQRYLCDYVWVEKKVIFRIQGDFWHANPALYDYNNLSKIQKFNIGRDKLAKTFFEGKGWKVFDVWESDIYWRPKVVGERIRPLLQLAAPTMLYTDCELKSHDNYWNEALRKRWFSTGKKKTKQPKKKKKCIRCKKEFTYIPSITRKYCSSECAHWASRVANRPSAEVLKQEIEEMSWCALGRKYGVSDNAIRKWARQYKIID